MMETNVLVKEYVNMKEEPRIGVYVCHCGLNIAQTVDCEKVAELASYLDHVVVSKNIIYAC